MTSLDSPSVPNWLSRIGSRRLIVPIVIIVASFATALLLLALLGQATWTVPVVDAPPPASSEADLAVATTAAEKRLDALRPRGVWVVVDTWNSRLTVFRDGVPLREAVCSAGSGTALRDPRTGKHWVFMTPVGERKVRNKVRDPVWKKPDWAFIEEGLEPPSLGSRDRLDDFSLGDYALYLGDGYMIHGTIFQTLLGQRVTHGCIRLGDEDLAYVYKQVPVGSRVYIY